MEVSMADIILAGPLQFDGLALKLLRKSGRLNHKIRFRLTPEATAKQGLMNDHVFHVHLQYSGNTLAGRPRILNRCPGLGLAILDPDHCHWRLHGGLRHVRHIVGCRHTLFGLLQGGLDIAGLADNFAGRLRRLFKRPPVSI